MTLSPKLGVVEISTLWHFRLPLLIQMFIKVASSPRLSGMPSPILWSHLLKMRRIVLLSSLLWWELGTNSLITGPGEWLSLRRFTSKLSWSWSCPPIPELYRTILELRKGYMLKIDKVSVPAQSGKSWTKWEFVKRRDSSWNKTEKWVMRKRFECLIRKTDYSNNIATSYCDLIESCTIPWSHIFYPADKGKVDTSFYVVIMCKTVLVIFG